MGNTCSRHLTALCSGLFLIAAAPFTVEGVQTSIDAASADGKALCAGKPAEPCAQASVIDFKRLRDAWFSPETTSQQRDQIAQTIQKSTTGGKTDWQQAATEYFAWRTANTTMGVAGGPIYLGNKPVRTTCSTTTKSYYGYYTGGSTSTTTCTTN